MAGLGFTAQTHEDTTGTSAQTVLQIKAPTNQKIKISEWEISFKGIVNTDPPVLVEVYRQSTAGGGGAGLTLVKDNPDDGATIQSTAQEAVVGTTQPMNGDCLFREEVHPQAGYSWQAPFGKEYLIAGGQRIGIVVTATVARNCVARMRGEE